MGTAQIDGTPERTDETAWRHVPLADEPEHDARREDPDYPAQPAWEDRL